MKEILQEIGLSKNEGKIYIKLLEVGVATGYEISKKTKTYKANTYDALNNLVSKNIITKKIIDHKTCYEARDPGVLMELMDVKRNKLMDVLPELRLKQRSVEKETKVDICKGSEEIVNLLYWMLGYKEPILIYGVPKEASVPIKEQLNLYHKRRIKQGIKMCHIYNTEATERMKELKKLPLTPIRVLPETFNSNVTTIVCGDCVSFLMQFPQVKIIKIIDKDMARSYKNYFKLLWDQAKK